MIANTTEICPWCKTESTCPLRAKGANWCSLFIRVAEPRGDIRESVRWFSEQMERKLKANDNKSHWSGIRTMHLFDMLIAETKELHSAFRIDEGLEGLTSPAKDMGRIIDEAADVANFAMMIADRARE